MWMYAVLASWVRSCFYTWTCIWISVRIGLGVEVGAKEKLSVEVQLQNKLYRVKVWPGKPTLKPKNYTFRAYRDAAGAWEAVLEDAKDCVV
jgi:hypothetical protein